MSTVFSYREIDILRYFSRHTLQQGLSLSVPISADGQKHPTSAIDNPSKNTEEFQSRGESGYCREGEGREAMKGRARQGKARQGNVQVAATD